MARGRQQTSKGRGVIEAVARTGKSFKIGEDWFGVFHAKQMQGAQKGDEVEFEFVEVNKGGATFLNVEGDVTIVSEGDGERAPARRPSGAAPARGGGRQAPARSSAPSDDPRQRSIVRQNSLTQANALFATLSRAGLLGDVSPTDLADEVVEIARVFEKYSMVEDE